MKISVCVVTYNQSDVIERCLDSILQQKIIFENCKIEVIVVDDASNDGTKDVLRKYENRNSENISISIFINDKNIGPFENYKYAHSLATGGFICHCDGDDYWLPEKLQKQIEFLIAHEDCSAVYTNAILVDSYNVIFGEFNGSIKEIFDTKFLIEKGNFLHHSSMMYRKEFFEIINNLENEFIDYEIHIRLSKFGYLGYINHCYTAYAVNYSGSLLRMQNKKIADLYFKSFFAVDFKDEKFFFLAKIIARELIFNLYLNKIKNLNFSVSQIYKKFGLFFFITVFYFVPLVVFSKLISKIFRRNVKKSNGFILHPR